MLEHVAVIYERRLAVAATRLIRFRPSPSCMRAASPGVQIRSPLQFMWT